MNHRLQALFDGFQRIRCGRALAVALMTVAGAAQGQIQITARAEHSQMLQFENIRVEFKITNLSAYPLPVGGENGARLSFRVERRPGIPLDEIEGGLHIDSMVIPPRETKSGWVDLSRAYNLGPTGPYTLQARLDWEGVRNQSGRFYVDVVPGLVLSTMNVGVAGGQRTVSLRTLSRDQTLRLFLRVEDERAKVCYGVHDLGRLLRHDPPHLAVDRSGQIHVLHQSGPTRYTHSTFSADASPMHSEFVGKQGTPAQLISDDAGKVVVRGGEVYAGDVSVDRPQIRPFNPFSEGSVNPVRR